MPSPCNIRLVRWRTRAVAPSEEHPQTALSYNNVAFNLRAQNKYKQAEEGFAKALAINRKVLGEEHPDTARTYGNVAGNLNAQGKYEEAEQELLRAANSFAKARLHIAATGARRCAGAEG